MKRRLIILNIILLLVTTVHHIYGGLLYATNWRIVGTLYGGFYCLVAVVLLQYSNRNSAVRFLGMALSYFWAIVIGYYEGGYNHALKNLLFILEVPIKTLDILFPPEFGYKIPDNFTFELSGILQLVIGIMITNALKTFKKGT